ncbi:hypothetical protein [Catellatospora methionotrophica]|uniref:hypothetical protein n=1 Tax=Catellatospora methionotrophica TaxID=121620 RepID=UPI0033E587D0
MSFVSARVLGWTALALAVAATIAVVPPLIMPDPQPDRPPSAAGPSGLPTGSPTPAVTPRTSAPPRPSVPPAARSHAVLPPRATTPAAFKPVTVHAADPANLRVGARVIACPTCVDGSRVGYIGGPNTLAVRVTGVPRAGEWTLTVVYETEQPRTLKIAVDGGPVRELALAGAGSWLIPVRTSLRLRLPKGACWIRFFNDTGSAPDINTITVG